MNPMLEPYEPKTTVVAVSDGTQERAEVEALVRARAALCAAVALEPVPLLDLAIVLPLHLQMVVQIGKVYGFDLSTTRAKEIVLELGSAVALTYATRTATRSVLKLVPVLGPVLNAPIVFTGTYALGMLAQTYFRARRADLPPLERNELNALGQEFLTQAKGIFRTVRLEDWQRVAKEVFKKRAK
jgi:uncharacterized protein (DUF697 family)